MAAPAELSDDQIAICRELLLSQIQSGKEQKSSQKAALKKMLSAVIAARNAGISFETIKALLNKAGMPITVETLKKYYFDLRKELEIAVAAKQHAKKVANVQAAIQKKLIFRDLATLENPVGTQPGTPIQQAQKEKRSPAKPREKENKTPVSKEITPEVVSNALLSVSVAAENMAVAMESPVPATVATQPISFAIEAKQEAQTLEEIEALSLEREKDDSFSHPSLLEDVILQDGLVYFASGKPYLGTLKKKQIYLLRESGRLIAPTPSRTGKDFVTMPRVL
jgi:hypothetical protein